MFVDRPPLEKQERPAATGLCTEARAERLLAEYLRQWGLRDPSAIATQCRRWVRRATGRADDLQAPSSSRGDLAEAALADAMRDMDRWLDHLALLVSPVPTEAAARRGLLAMALPTVIDRYPQALLQYESLPASFVQQLREAARPVVPVATQLRRMQGPPLGELPPLLQPRHWRRFFGGLATALRETLACKGDG